MCIEPKIYLVGGAVRDKLLGIKNSDHDYVVVGATPQYMLDKGYISVGSDFPVFLHPTTHEEYALARTERKSGHGYHGFIFSFTPDVTLEEDLYRRDITINAMAMDLNSNEIIDPYNGQEDLKNGILRHVSEAFKEDPVRVLRIARFSATFKFKIHESTISLLKDIVESGETKHLVKERIYKEMKKALLAPYPSLFFNILATINALPDICSQLALLKRYNAIEFDKTLCQLDEGIKNNFTIEQQFCVLTKHLPLITKYSVQTIQNTNLGSLRKTFEKNKSLSQKLIPLKLISEEFHVPNKLYRFSERFTLYCHALIGLSLILTFSFSRDSNTVNLQVSQIDHVIYKNILTVDDIIDDLTHMILKLGLTKKTDNDDFMSILDMLKLDLDEGTFKNYHNFWVNFLLDLQSIDFTPIYQDNMKTRHLIQPLLYEKISLFIREKLIKEGYINSK